MCEMNEQDWKLAYELAQSLEGRDINAVEKLQVYLRTRRDVEGCQELLSALATNSGQFQQMSREQRWERGVSFIRTESMAKDYQHLSSSLNKLFSSGREAEKQAHILGWVARLMKYARAGGDLKELVTTRATASGQPPAISPQPGIMTNAATVLTINQKIKPTKQPPPKLRVEIKRETVTLMAAAKGGKAPVKTVRGEEITCTGLPAYPSSEAGQTCRADVTREDGKATKAVFKGWA